MWFLFQPFPSLLNLEVCDIYLHSASRLSLLREKERELRARRSSSETVSSGRSLSSTMPARSLSKKKLLVLCVLTGFGGLCLSSWVRHSSESRNLLYGGQLEWRGNWNVGPSSEPWGATKAAALAAAAVPDHRPAAAAHSLPKQPKKRDSSEMTIQAPDEEVIQAQQKPRGQPSATTQFWAAQFCMHRRTEQYAIGGHAVVPVPKGEVHVRCEGQSGAL